MIRRYLYIYVALALTAPAAFGQDDNPQETPAAVTSPAPSPAIQESTAALPTPQTLVQPDAPTPVQPPVQTRQEPSGEPTQPLPAQRARPVTPQMRPYSHRRKRIPLEQYSPLAAQGGYSHRWVSPWQVVVNYFNPHHLNMGKLWEERRQAWLDNAANNEYFWYCYWATGILF